MVRVGALCVANKAARDSFHAILFHPWYSDTVQYMALSPATIVYLNNAATSWPKPPQVENALRESLALPFFGSGRTTGSEGEDYATRAREELSALFSIDNPDTIAFTHNATDSLNILIQGFLAGNAGGCHVLSTALDHNSVLRPLHEYQGQGRIRLDILPFRQGYVSPEQVSEAIIPGTRLMVMTQGSNVLGTVQDIRAIGEILHDHGVYFIVDGAQAAGHIPVSLADLPVDAWAFTGHKGLFGIPGTGGFWVKDPGTIAPVRFGGTGTDSASLFHPREAPSRFEAGTPGYPGLAALAAGAGFVAGTGIRAIKEKAQRQTRYLVRELSEEPSITVHHASPELPIISFNIGNLPCDDAGFILARAYGIIARTGRHCAPLVHKIIDGGEGSIRVSLSWYTTDEECRAAAHAIREIARNADPSVGTA